MARITERVRDFISSATIKHDLLMDMLSEFQVAEETAQRIYQIALQHISEPEIANKYQAFLQRTTRHKALLDKIVHELGGDPNYVSPIARLAEKKSESLLQTMESSDGLSPTLIELNATENMFVVETKNWTYWELLGKISRQATDEHLRTVLKPIVDEVESEKEEQVDWISHRMSDLAFRALCT